jgi:hypothetical protein
MEITIKWAGAFPWGRDGSTVGGYWGGNCLIMFDSDMYFSIYVLPSSIPTRDALLPSTVVMSLALSISLDTEYSPSPLS